ncbi:MAG: hypothetical protein JWM25_1377 [Thermoleophilia bacterium]|nr:hypothetical protein [Thermoleophilia bacterium]
MALSPITAAARPVPPTIPAQVAALPDLSKTERATLNHAMQRENELVGNAVTKLGGTPTPATSLDSFVGRAVSSEGTDPGRAVQVPLGTSVATGPYDTWTVAGIDPKGSLSLARQDAVTGATEKTTKPWSELVERSVELLDSGVRDATGRIWNVMADPESVAALGRKAPALMFWQGPWVENKPGTVSNSKQPEMVFESTWGDAIDGALLSKRQPVAAPASGVGASALRRAVGDQTVVRSKVGVGSGLRPVLAATESDRRGGEQALAGADAIKNWFQQKTGIEVWPKRERLEVHTDDADMVANAAAGTNHEGTERSFTLYEGPRNQSVREAMLHRVPGGRSGHADEMTRKFSKMIKDNDESIRAHEAGHIANGVTWSALGYGQSEDYSSPKVQEAGVVDEAFADLFGAAKANVRSLGVRDIKALSHDYGSLDLFRKTMARDGENFDVHAGTQLVTRPMHELASKIGWDAVAEVTGAAAQSLGAQLRRGDFETVGITEASRALRTAAAWRFGENSETLKAMDAEWQRLGVLQPEPLNPPRPAT